MLDFARKREKEQEKNEAESPNFVWTKSLFRGKIDANPSQNPRKKNERLIFLGAVFIMGGIAKELVGEYQGSEKMFCKSAKSKVRKFPERKVLTSMCMFDLRNTESYG